MTSEGRGEMTFLEHFEELRSRIFKGLMGLLAALAVVSVYVKPLMDFLLAPYYRYLPEEQQSLAYTQVTEIFFVYMKFALVGAVFLGAPWFFYQLWAFIAPGLKRRERLWAFPFVLFTSLFFMGGMVFSYMVVIPVTLRFFFSLNQGYTNVVTLSSFWAFEMKFLLALGLVFETPILIFLLTRLGLVSTGWLLRNTKWAVLVAFAVSAVITPSGDPVTQTIVALPIVILYLLGIAVSWIFRKRSAEGE